MDLRQCYAGPTGISTELATNYTASHENGGTSQRVNSQETCLHCIPKRPIDSGGEAIEQRLGT